MVTRRLFSRTMAVSVLLTKVHSCVVIRLAYLLYSSGSRVANTGTDGSLAVANA